jgi:hypothetical protein
MKLQELMFSVNFYAWLGGTWFVFPPLIIAAAVAVAMGDSGLLGPQYGWIGDNVQALTAKLPQHWFGPASPMSNRVLDTLEAGVGASFKIILYFTFCMCGVICVYYVLFGPKKQRRARRDGAASNEHGDFSIADH